ncbi:MAG: Stp1/IreP family PP2C-type Ser/Thr phosphatase [Gemmatimonadetes bacterium]|nr:Stp1/IreP family PP2C-type Ser/Thr phosphatase [Gemmatimonadota bacterium]
MTVSATSSNSPSPAHGVRADVSALTDVGRTREHNEDAYLVADLETGVVLDVTAGTTTVAPGPHGTLFLVADGMGGAASGELASSMACTLVFEAIRAAWGTAAPTVGSFAEVLRDATVGANQRIHQHAREFPEHRGMGTTATIAGQLGDHLYVVQVGDSRAYLVRDGVARQITKDQSLMQRLVEAGELTQEEAERSERRNIILQALGPEPSVTVDITQQQLRRGDVLVLCSDGLSGQVKADEIAHVVVQEQDMRVVCKRLIDRANARGGPDNITVVAVRFDGEGLADVTTTDSVGYTAYPLPGTLNDLNRDFATPRTPASVIKSDPTPRFGTQKPTAEEIEAERARLGDLGSEAAMPSLADEGPRVVGMPPEVVEHRRELAQPIYVVLGVVALAAVAWLVYQWRAG